MGWGKKFICRVWSLTNLRIYFVSQVSRRELNERETHLLTSRAEHLGEVGGGGVHRRGITLDDIFQVYCH